MSTISTGNHPKALWPGVNAWFGAKYGEHSPEYPAIFAVQGSSQNYEEDVEQKGFGLATVKPEGTSTAYDSHSQGYISRYTHVAYSLGYICTKEELDDNLYDKVSRQRAGSLAFSMAQTRENVGANVLNRAFTAAYAGGDGLELLSAVHTSDAGTWANEITAADLSEASLEDLCILIGNATNSKGLKISIQPQRLIIPVTEQFNAARILESIGQSDSSNQGVGAGDLFSNNINAMRIMGSIPEVTVNHYLTSDDAYFIKTNAPEGMKWFDRIGTEFSQDNDFDTDNAKAKAYMRFSAGWSDPRGMYGAPGT
jgi:hypothetical protein